MKRLLFVVGLLFFSCEKKSTISNEENIDTLNTAVEMNNTQVDSLIAEDSVSDSSNSIVAERMGMSREVSGNQIIRTANASQLPFRIVEEFTEEEQKFILKIQNFEKEKISAEVIPEQKDQNIRINQIKLPNGEYDGPFGRDLVDYEVKDNGEVWLIFGRSLMASGSSVGHFSVIVK